MASKKIKCSKCVSYEYGLLLEVMKQYEFMTEQSMFSEIIEKTYNGSIINKQEINKVKDFLKEVL